MGYSIKCTFFTDKNGNQEIISKGIIDDLKIINGQKYSISFDDVNPTSDNIKLNNDEICGAYSTEYSFSIPNDLVLEYDNVKLSVKDFLNKFGTEYKDNDTESIKYVITNDKQDLIDLLKKYKIDYTMEDLISGTKDDIEIWEFQYNKEYGYIFDQNSFIQGALYYNSKIEEERKAIINLQNIINSAEYYKLDLNQRENVTEDLQGSNEAKEVFESCYLACRKMIDLFEYFEHEEIIDDNWNDRNSKVYCYISAI